MGNESHRGVQNLTHDLNQLYRNTRPCHDLDFQHEGFSWVDCNDAEHSVLSYLRRARDGSCVIVVLNLTPVPRKHYRIGLPVRAQYREVLNSDSQYYAGSNMGNAGSIDAEAMPWMGLPYSAEITLPPLAGIIMMRNM